MGFDLYALDPITDSEKHGYFRANVWYWRPLWAFVNQICQGELTDDIIKGGQYNDGFEIEDETAKLIGTRIINSLNNNTFQEYKNEHENNKQNIPEDNCSICALHANQVNPSCHRCKGTGKTTNIITAYMCNEELTREFADFCLHSGGFEIC